MDVLLMYPAFTLLPCKIHLYFLLLWSFLLHRCQVVSGAVKTSSMVANQRPSLGCAVIPVKLIILLHFKKRRIKLLYITDILPQLFFIQLLLLLHRPLSYKDRCCPLSAQLGACSGVLSTTNLIPLSPGISQITGERSFHLHISLTNLEDR